MRRFFSRPRLSIVVIVYKMADQAEKTLYSLSPHHQQGVSKDDYEIIVVENDSPWLLGRERATAVAPNIRYVHRIETQRTPVNAINHGASLAKGSHVAIMIDGARMVTPGVVRLMLDAFRMAPNAAVCVPGYHLGEKLQQVAVNEGYNEQVEAQLLERSGWLQDGYRLFDIAVLSGSCLSGFFGAIYESNCVALSVRKWKALKGMDTRYNDFGGGMANLAFYKRLLESPNTPYYLLFGEGTFHQFHGGVTTGTPSDEHKKVFKALEDQDVALRGANRDAPKATPILLGHARANMHKFLQYSLDKVSGRTTG